MFAKDNKEFSSAALKGASKEVQAKQEKLKEALRSTANRDSTSRDANTNRTDKSA